HEADGLRLRELRLQVRVGARGERHRGLRSPRAGRDEALLQLAIAHRNVLEAASRTGRGAEDGVARIDEAAEEGVRRAAVQVADGRGAEALRPGRADQQVFDRTPV